VRVSSLVKVAHQKATDGSDSLLDLIVKVLYFVSIESEPSACHTRVQNQQSLTRDFPCACSV